MFRVLTRAKGQFILKKQVNFFNSSKNEQKISATVGLGKYLNFQVRFFGRIEDTQKIFRN